MKKIIICATQRSGSTLLCKELEATGVLGRPKEFYLKAATLSSKAEANDFIAMMTSAGTTENGVFAVKLMQDQWHLVEKAHSEFSTHLVSDISKKIFNKPKVERNAQSLYDFYKDALWVYLQRQDLIAQAVSREMARQTNICHAVPNGASKAGLGAKHGHCLEGSELIDYNLQTHYDFDSIFKHVQAIKREEQLWQEFFSAYKINPFSLSYERIVTAKAYLLDLAGKLNIHLPHTPVNSSLLKLANEVNDEWSQLFRQDLQTRHCMI